MIAYVDASVLLRVALGEAGALPEWTRISRGVSSALIATESLRTLDRLRLRTGLGDPEVATRRAAILRLIASLAIVEIDAAILHRAAQPMPTELGTLDAIHLATALLWKESTRGNLIMATHDTALALAARAHGLPVVGALNRDLRGLTVGYRCGASALHFRATAQNGLIDLLLLYLHLLLSNIMVATITSDKVETASQS